MHGRTVASATLFGDDVRVENGSVAVRREQSLRSEAMDALARHAVFEKGQARDRARWMIWQIARAVGVHPASIHDLYMARGRGEVGGFTVPAINVRGMAYDTARAIFRAAVRLDAGAFIVEIARSEIAYTEQRPAEYVSVMLAAALREGFRGPVFLQGDHFQVNAKKHAADPTGEVAAVKQLAHEAISAGFYNIDVDTSTLVDPRQGSLDEQQRANYETAADIIGYVREIQPSQTSVSVGAEIGEVGGHNSTVAELRAFMEGFERARDARGITGCGISKISVQTGTSHGGVVLPDGSVGEAPLDLEVLALLSRVARETYGLAGAVQHGASTLPETGFGVFPAIDTAEIHLATGFQNILFDNIPEGLRRRMYAWLDANATAERREGNTPEQFYYKARKRALGPFKRELWELPQEAKDRLASAYDRTFGSLMQQLRVAGTAGMVSRYVRPIVKGRTPEDGPAVPQAPDDPDAGE